MKQKQKQPPKAQKGGQTPKAKTLQNQKTQANLKNIPK